MSEQAQEEYEDSPDVEEQAEQEEHEEQQEAPKDAPKDGHKTLDQFLDSGGREEDYRGRNAYKDKKRDIRKQQSLKRELKEMRNTQDQLLDQFAQMTAGQLKQQKAAINTQISEAVDEGDAEKVARLKDEMATIPEPEERKQKQEEPNIPEYFLDFVEENGIIDEGSDDFNEDVADLFQTKVMKEIQRNGPPRDEREGKRILQNAYKASTTTLKQRRTPQKARQNGKKVVNNEGNAGDLNPTQRLAYDQFLKMPKVGKQVAADFLKRSLGGR